MRFIGAPEGQMEPWGYAGDHLMEEGVVDLPDNIHEGPLYPPRRTPKGLRRPGRREPLEYGGDLRWEEGVGIL